MNELLPLDKYGLAFIGLYLLVLLGIGFAGYRSRKENSMRDFYLAGNGIGFVSRLGDGMGNRFVHLMPLGVSG